MDPPIQTEYFLSGGAMILIFMVDGARVLATGIKTSTDHGVSNIILSISVTAVIITDNWDIHLHQDLGKAATLGGGSPSRDSAGSSSIVFLSIRWKPDAVNH